MKSILYVGATLMIGASIYGFVDYKQTSHKKEFKDMYVEPAVPTETAVVATPEKKTVPAVAAETKAVAKKTKPAVTKKAIVEKEESLPVIKPIAADEKLNPETTTIETTSVTVIPAKENNVAKPVKKRKLSTKLFSRGALDERYIEPKVKVEKKADVKKLEDKEQ
jgi:hypothetical protein